VRCQQYRSGAPLLAQLDVTTVSYPQEPPSPPDDPYAWPAYPEVPPRPGTSRLAVTGLILAVVLPPVGLVLSIIARSRTGPDKLAGRSLAVAGIITAVVVGAGATITVVALANSPHPTDPGCVALQHPDIKIKTAAGGPDFQGFVDIFNQAADKAQHDDVKKALRTVADDYKFLEGGVSSGARPSGQTPDFRGDLQWVESVCGRPTTVQAP
jgi:hypothetical protein